MLMRLFKNHWIDIIIILVEQTLISIKTYKQEREYFVNHHLPVGMIAQGLPMSIENYLKEVRSPILSCDRAVVFPSNLSLISHLQLGSIQVRSPSKNSPVNNRRLAMNQGMKGSSSGQEA